MGPEARVQASVISYARGEDVVCIKLTMLGAIGVKGWPDFLLLYHGKVLFIEFKAPGAKATPLQLSRHEVLKRHGFKVVIVDNANEGKGLVDFHLFVPGRAA